ncbi:hypothetical protein PC114_g8498 [Phytophthora cactorum]|nr:hypothetical protein PC114_g8498 [Phytophthora cactorum]KAG2982350.1 hypothetical protein PC120_g24659 [Phytophthora cactorum]KAG4056364.1 hypothetical protein PC123_g8583 [Phytophthora cactorum]
MTAGFVTVHGMAVGWVCMKQGGVSLSTMEAEYTAHQSWVRSCSEFERC